MTTSTAVVAIAILILAGVALALGFARRATLLLTAKYLVKRRLAWVSLAAVALCVALVLIVFSVMGGWLKMFKSSFKTLSGDLIVSTRSQSPFGYYDAMIGEIEKLPEVEAACPIIRTAGVLYLNFTPDFQDYVIVVGMPPIDRIEKVMNFKESLWLQHGIAAFDDERKPFREPASFDLWRGLDYGRLNPNDKQAVRRPGMIVGGGVMGVHVDRETGRPTWPLGMEGVWGRLTVVPSDAAIGGGSTVNATTTPYWMVDGSRTQAPQHDKNIYVPFAQLQKDLNLTAYDYEDIATGRHQTAPARATEIQIKVRPGVDAAALKPKITGAIRAALAANRPPAERPTTQRITAFGNADDEIGGLRVETWEDQQSGFLNAVENEITIMMVLFGVISLVAVFMIFCIFYTIVAEKTRDIGILKSVGGSSWHVAQIFLTYGAAIGVVGGGAGVVLGTTFVHYINEIHALIAKVTGREIFNSAVYVLDKLPNQVEPRAAIVIYIVGIFAAIFGALVPAIRAARLNPIEALRFE